MLKKVLRLCCFVTFICSVAVYSECISEKLNLQISKPPNNTIGRYNDAKLREFPFMISIQIKSGNKRNHMCGGILIRRDLIVAPSICLFHPCIKSHKITNRRYLDNFIVFAGITRAYRNTNAEQVSGFNEIHRLPPAPNKRNLRTIALVVLSRPFILNNFVRPLRVLQLRQQSFTGAAIVIGWSQNKYDNNKVLKYSTVGVDRINRLDCLEYVRGIHHINTSDEDVCENPYETTTRLCYDNLGTVIVQSSNNRTYEFAGMNIWGNSCCDASTMIYNFMFESMFRYSIWLREMMELIRLNRD